MGLRIVRATEDTEGGFFSLIGLRLGEETTIRKKAQPFGKDHFSENSACLAIALAPVGASSE